MWGILQETVYKTSITDQDLSTMALTNGCHNDDVILLGPFCFQLLFQFVQIVLYTFSCNADTNSDRKYSDKADQLQQNIQVVVMQIQSNISPLLTMQITDTARAKNVVHTYKKLLKLFHGSLSPSLPTKFIIIFLFV